LISIKEQSKQVTFMSTIINIEPVRRKRNTYLLTLDDGTVHTLHEEVIVKYRLKSGKEVDPADLSQWVYEADVKVAFDMSLKFLGYRARSSKELTDYLKKKGFDGRVMEAVLEKLTDYSFVDDEAFADRWVKDRLAGKPVGKRWIAGELKNKGIKQETIDKALDAVDEQSEFERALVLGRKYHAKYAALPPRVQRGKIGQAIMRRGFDWETARAVVNRLVSDEDRDDVD